MAKSGSTKIDLSDILLPHLQLPIIKLIDANHIAGFNSLIMILVVTASVISGTDMMIRSHVLFKGDHRNIRPYYHCIGPMLAVVIIGIVLDSWPMESAWLAGLLCGMAFLVLVLITEYRAVEFPVSNSIRIRLLALYYPVGLLWLFWLVNIQVRAAISAIAAMVITSLLSFRFLYGHGLSVSRVISVLVMLQIV